MTQPTTTQQRYSPQMLTASQTAIIQAKQAIIDSLHFMQDDIHGIAQGVICNHEATLDEALDALREIARIAGRGRG